MTRDAFDQFQPPDRGRFGENESAPQTRRPGPRVSASSDLVDLTLMLRHEKPLSIAVTDPAKAQAAWIWLPRSQIEIEKKGRGVVVVTLPEWLAVEKRLI